MADDLDLRGPDLDEEPDELDTDNAEEPESDDPLEGETELQAALLKLYQQCCADDRFPRLAEVKDVWKSELYWAGRQYDWWSKTDQCFKPPTAAAGVNYGGDSSADDMPRFQFVTNIYQARGLVMIGNIAGAVPRMRFFPNDPDDDADLETAEGRTKLAKLIERWNPPQMMLQDEAYHAWTGGFICWRTKYVPMGEKMGYDSVDMLKESSEQPEATISCPSCGWSAPAREAMPPVPCPQCGKPLTEANISEEEPIPVPEDDGTSEVPKGREVIEIYGALNCKRPQRAKTQAQFHYFAIEDETHFSTARAEFEDKADKIRAGMNMGPDDMFERNARLSVADNSGQLTQSGADVSSLVTRATVWFRPTAFWMLEQEKDATESKRDRLLDIFPNGCRVEFSGTTYCTSAAESMDEKIVTTHAMPGRGQHRPGVGSSLISVQDRVNTNSNIEAETYEYGIPITYRDSTTFNPEANDDQRAAPGLEIEVSLQQGENINNKIMQVRADSPSPEMTKNNADLMGPVADMLTGTYPALSGAGDGAPDTLGQQAMQRDQAMGRMGVFYVPIKQAHADIITLACKDFEAHANGEVKIPVLAASGDFESESVDITALEGDAQAYPEGDENFPELWNQKRSTVMQVMDTPYGEALTQEPENLEFLIKIIGIPELKFPGRDSVRKQLKEIAEIVAAFSDIEAIGGETTPPLLPEVDPRTDNNEIESKTCGSYINGESGQKLKRNNPQAYEAIVQHKLKHDSYIAPPKPEEKPLSESFTIAFKDMPPEAQAQALERIGIHVSPQDFLEAVALKQAENAPKAHPAPFGIGTPAPAQPPPAGNEAPPAAGA